MFKRVLLILALFLVGFSSYSFVNQENKATQDWDIELLNTASKVKYLTEKEKLVVLEINKLRSNPSLYAEEVLVPRKKWFDGKKMNLPNGTYATTNEGVKALNEAIAALKKQKSLPLLYPSKGLSDAAMELAKHQEKLGTEGHESKTKYNLTKRLERYGKWDILCGENIAYGPSDAVEIVAQLVIDDGVADRGHRKNFLNSKFKMVGVAIANHKKYETTCLIDFAGDFIDK